MTTAMVSLGSLRPDEHGAFPVAGRPVRMPVEVRAARMAAATFLVPAGGAQSLIEPTGLRVEERAGRSMASLALVKYLDCDLGSYDELGLAIVVQTPPGAPPSPKGGVATYIHRLPVTQAFTCEAGRGIWGFPKWIADLRVDVGDGGAAAVLRSDDGREQLRIRIRGGPVRVPGRPLQMVCFSRADDGRVLRTEWTTTSSGQRMRLGPRSAEVDLGDGPFADDLRALGFPRRAVMSTTTTALRATFGPPEPVDLTR